MTRLRTLSSVGAAAALALGYRFCDTGLLYRAATWLALEPGVALDDPEALVPLVTEIELAPDEYGRLDRVLGRIQVESQRSVVLDQPRAVQLVATS